MLKASCEKKNGKFLNVELPCERRQGRNKHMLRNTCCRADLENTLLLALNFLHFPQQKPQKEIINLEDANLLIANFVSKRRSDLQSNSELTEQEVEDCEFKQPLITFPVGKELSTFT